LAYLASDVRAAKLYEVPLGAGIPFHQRLLRNATPPTVADVAMRIRLPVIEGIPPKVLIRIREDERDHFDRFRTQLRLAIKERLTTIGSNNPARIAAEIQKDMIDPELVAIRGRLTAAKRNVVKKSAVGVCMGALATTCGLLGSVTPATALLAGIAAGTAILGNAACNYLDERNEVGLNGMYFAWLVKKY
jgi:small-conductance mechanosensitive channel